MRKCDLRFSFAIRSDTLRWLGCAANLEAAWRAIRFQNDCSIRYHRKHICSPLFSPFCSVNGFCSNHFVILVEYGFCGQQLLAKKEKAITKIQQYTVTEHNAYTNANGRLCVSYMLFLIFVLLLWNWDSLGSLIQRFWLYINTAHFLWPGEEVTLS